jgi:serine phosphatase RsbU (regulator of sigma subunit)
LLAEPSLQVEDQSQMSRFRLLFFLVVCLVVSAFISANPVLGQSPEAKVTVGQSVIALTGPWKFHIGDDPQWADPKFDDSGWEDVDLASKAGSFDPILGLSGYVPGWTAKGHPHYWGYAWYRIRVQVNARPGENLAIVYTADVDDSYQVFANGLLLGSFGQFSKASKFPVLYNSQPRMFRLPETTSTGPVTVVLAYRVWMQPSTLLLAPDSGGFHSPPLLGQIGAITANYELAWVGYVRAYGPSFFDALLFFLLVILACSLTVFDRSDPVYLWLAAVFLLTALDRTFLCIAAWTQAMGLVTLSVLQDVVLRPLTLGGWVMVWWAWFRLRRPSWMPAAIAVLTLLYALTDLLGEDLFFTIEPHSVSAVFHLISVGVRILFLCSLIFVIFEGVAEQGREGWLALPAVILVGIAQFQTELSVLHVRTTWFPFGLQVTIGQIAELTLAVVIFVLLVRRLRMSLRHQRQMALDVKQAQEVQQVILPEAVTRLPGFAIESEYRPAREVGGDFFQIIPDARDGSVLIVAGDVAGKGLKAGMLVALLVGGIRSTVEFSREPKVVLESLNRRLTGRGDSFATCLVMKIAVNGQVTLANAGHLPPYLNGRPVAMEGALPLGIVPEAEFSLMRFELKQGDRLVVVSDGIAEAMDAEGKLFGFERVEQMLVDVGKSGAMSAAAVADTAQRFGQQDDISVIAVTRTEVTEPVPA